MGLMYCMVCPVYAPAFTSTKSYCLVAEAHGLNKVVTRQHGGQPPCC